MNLKRNIALLLTTFFMAFISAPTIISAVDDSIDITVLFGFNEEEEIQDAKLLLEEASLDSVTFILDCSDEKNQGYTYKKYTKPQLNLVSPPPKPVL